MPKLPVKIKPGALPAVTEEVTQGVLDKLPQVDRREFLGGALSTLADTSALGKVADVLAPVAKSAEKAKDSVLAFFTKFTDDIYDVFSDSSVRRQLDEAEEFSDDIGNSDGWYGLPPSAKKKIDDALKDYGVETYNDLPPSAKKKIDDINASDDVTDASDDVIAVGDDINMGQMETWMYLKIPEEDLPYLAYFEHGGDDIVDVIDDIVKKKKITKDDLANYLEENNMAPTSQDLKDYGLEKYDDLLKYKEHRDLTKLE